MSMTWPSFVLAAILAMPVAAMESIRVAPDGKGFVQAESGRPFVPWGANYDHDGAGRLLEDYWSNEWDRVVQDFGEMKDLGVNVVRVHLQTGRFLRAADRPDEAALVQLRKLLRLAEDTGLYLDITGLGCYHAADVPAWYDALEEEGRWAAQAVFWDAVAACCATSPAVFCYDLMNEPVVPGDGRQDRWLAPPFAGKCFVQFITRSAAGRPRPQVARAWAAQLAAAIRARDARHLITVGLVPWSLNRPGLTSGFEPAVIAPEVDFIATHIYPEAGKGDEALDTLKGFAVGKPVVVEEMFPLKCSAPELSAFIRHSKPWAAGWIGFYWGRTPDECRAGGTISDAITLGWLEILQRGVP